jgi:hypothetical protein
MICRWISGIAAVAAEASKAPPIAMITSLRNRQQYAASRRSHPCSAAVVFCVLRVLLDRTVLIDSKPAPPR